MQEVTTYDIEKRYIFSNWTSEDFTCTWGGVPTTIKSGETIEVPEYKAFVFTKHLVDREMMRDGKENSTSSAEARKPYESKTVAPISTEVDSPALATLKAKILEEVEVETGKKPAKKAKKEKEEEIPKEEEFGGLVK